MERHICTYVDSLKTDDGYRFSEYSDTTILSTSFAVSTLYLLNQEIIDKEKMIRYLSGIRTDEGFINDRNYIPFDHFYHHKDYILPQFTYYSLMALDILGYKMERFKFIEDLTVEKISALLNSFFTKNFWATSNQLMFLLYFLSYAEKNNLLEKEITSKYFDLIFGYINSKQNAENGYWGGGDITPSVFHQAYGAAHTYIFYDYFDREIQYVNHVIDATLKLHAENGLIETINGGACEDYNIVDIYLRCLKQTDYRRNEITDKLLKMRKSIIKSQFNNGGFPYKIQKSSLTRLFKKQDLTETYKYSSWDKMETFVYKPDIWSTFFRTLTIKVIDYIIDSNKTFPSTKLPGWGYLGKNVKN